MRNITIEWEWECLNMKSERKALRMLIGMMRSGIGLLRGAVLISWMWPQLSKDLTSGKSLLNMVKCAIRLWLSWKGVLLQSFTQSERRVVCVG